MDGNGRWAKRRFLPRVMGHQRGAEAIRNLVRDCRDSGLEALTLYAFSTENWSRPAAEVADLMGILRRFILADLQEIHENNVRLKVIGEWSALPADLVAMLQDALDLTAGNSAMTLVLALNYGGRQEIARAAAKAAEKGAVTMESIEAELDTADLPPLDLMIRTSGEERLSNFLLWQAAYAELWFTDVYWPDFTIEHLNQGLAAFGQRERRFGGR